jgi:hypothetical protein
MIALTVFFACRPARLQLELAIVLFRQKAGSCGLFGCRHVAWALFCDGQYQVCRLWSQWWFKGEMRCSRMQVH